MKASLTEQTESKREGEEEGLSLSTRLPGFCMWIDAGCLAPSTATARSAGIANCRGWLLLGQGALLGTQQCHYGLFMQFQSLGPQENDSAVRPCQSSDVNTVRGFQLHSSRNPIKIG
jgi:hypothetical protein